MSLALLMAPYQTPKVGQCIEAKDCNKYFTSSNWACVDIEGLRQCTIEEGEPNAEEAN